MEIQDVKLRPIDIDDLGLMYKWRNDPAIMIRTRQYRMLTWAEHEIWFENLNPDKNQMYAICLEFVTATTGSLSAKHVFRMIGVCGLCSIDWVNRSAEISIYIGNKDYQRKKIGSKALHMLCHIAFKQMNLHKVWAEVYNLGIEYGFPHAFFTKNGFTLDGEQRDTVFKNGEFYSSSFLSLLEDEYE